MSINSNSTGPGPPGQYLDFGDDFGQKVDLTVRIREILRNYPEGTSILKELIQNADDAGAAEICFCLDRREHPSSSVVAPSLADFQGPALLAYNDAQFTDRDFASIQRIGDSLKDDISTKQFKTGKFGIGFNSVYHLTDLPSFVSGTRIVLFDPQASILPNVNPHNPGKMIDFSKRRNLVSELSDQFVPLKCFGNNFEKSFQGTLFRFPLRTEGQAASSRLSNRVHTVEQTQNLLREFSLGAAESLLFLKNIRRITISVWEPEDTKPTQFYEVDASNVNTSEVTQARDRLVRLLGEMRDEDTPTTVDYELTLAIKSFPESSSAPLLERQEMQRWMICCQVGGEKSAEIARRAKDMHLSTRLVPYGAVAWRYDDTPGTPRVEGQAFCTLALPVQTGLSVHVDGFFELSSNRRDLWFGKDMSGFGKLKSDWNSTLLCDVIAPCYVRLMNSATAKEYTPDRFQQLWPKISTAMEQWKELHLRIYGLCLSEQVFPCGRNHPVRWLNARESVFIPSSISNAQRLETLLRSDGENVVLLDDAVLKALERVAPSTGIRILSPEICREFYVAKGEHVSTGGSPDSTEALRNCFPSFKEKANIRLLSDYLFSDWDSELAEKFLINGLPCIPLLSDGIGILRRPSMTVDEVACIRRLAETGFDIDQAVAAVLRYSSNADEAAQWIVEHPLSHLCPITGEKSVEAQSPIFFLCTSFEVDTFGKATDPAAERSSSKLGGNPTEGSDYDLQAEYRHSRPFIIDKVNISPAVMSIFVSMPFQVHSNVRSMSPDYIQLFLPLLLPIGLKKRKEVAFWFKSHEGSVREHDLVAIDVRSYSCREEAAIRKIWEYVIQKEASVEVLGQEWPIIPTGEEYWCKLTDGRFLMLEDSAALTPKNKSGNGDFEKRLLDSVRKLGVRTLRTALFSKSRRFPKNIEQYAFKFSARGMVAVMQGAMAHKMSLYEEGCPLKSGACFEVLSAEERLLIRGFILESNTDWSEKEIAFIRTLPIFPVYSTWLKWLVKEGEKIPDAPLKVVEKTQHVLADWLPHWKPTASADTHWKPTASADMAFVTLEDAPLLLDLPLGCIEEELLPPVLLKVYSNAEVEAIKKLGAQCTTPQVLFAEYVLPALSIMEPGLCTIAGVSLLKNLASWLRRDGDKILKKYLSSARYVFDQAGKTLWNPKDLVDPAEAELVNLVPSSAFPAFAYRTQDCLDAMRGQGLQRSLSRSRVIALAKSIEGEATEVAKSSDNNLKNQVRKKGGLLLLYVDRHLNQLFPSSKSLVSEYASAEGLTSLMDSAKGGRTNMFETLWDRTVPRSVVFDGSMHETFSETPTEILHEVEDVSEEEGRRQLMLTRWVPVREEPSFVALPRRVAFLPLDPTSIPFPDYLRDTLIPDIERGVQNDSLENSKHVAQSIVEAPCLVRLPAEEWHSSAMFGILDASNISPTLCKLLGMDRPLSMPELGFQLKGIVRRYSRTEQSFESGDSSRSECSQRETKASLNEVLTIHLPTLYQALHYRIKKSIASKSDRLEFESLQRILEDTPCIWVSSDDQDGDSETFSSEDITEQEGGSQKSYNGGLFVKASQVAFDCPGQASPYLFSVPDDLRPLQAFLDAVGVRKSFGESDFIMVLQCMASKYSNCTESSDRTAQDSSVKEMMAKIITEGAENAGVEENNRVVGPKHIEPASLPERELLLAISLLQRLSDSKQCTVEWEIFAPDEAGKMRRASDLVYDDAPWMPRRGQMAAKAEGQSGTEIQDHLRSTIPSTQPSPLRETNLELSTEYQQPIKFVHPKISNLVAAKVGMKSFRLKILSGNAAAFEFDGPGEAFGQTEPLTGRLRNILELYADGPSVFHELIQNADDAGATEVKILLSKASFGTSSLFGHRMDRWQGPALYFYNNALFKEGDFTSLARIGQMRKASSLTTTGRFGLGFNAVYHYTDLPAFVSGEFLEKSEFLAVILDPHARYLPSVSLQKPGMRLKFSTSRIAQQFPDQTQPFMLFGCDMQHPFDGTLFRFALRDKAAASESEIRREAYSFDGLYDLLEMFKEKIQHSLLFLRRVKKIEVLLQSDAGGSPQLWYSAEVKRLRAPKEMGENTLLSLKKAIKGCDVAALESPDTVINSILDTFVLGKDRGGMSKEAFMAKLSSTPHSQLPRVNQIVRINVQETRPNSTSIKDLLGDHPSKASKLWTDEKTLPQNKPPTLSVSTSHVYLVSSAMGSGRARSMAISKEYAHMKVLPWSEVAADISPDDDASIGPFGHAFCFLPLPVATGFPVHINGYFQLSANRRDIWHGDDMSGDGKRKAEWNQALLQDVSAPCYASLILCASRLLGPTEQFYRLFPRSAPGPHTPWKGVHSKLFFHLSNVPFLFSNVRGGEWVSPRQAILLADGWKSQPDRVPIGNNIGADWTNGDMTAVKEALIEEGKRVVTLPQWIVQSLLAATPDLTTACPALVRQIYKESGPHPSLLKRTRLISLLRYAVSDLAVPSTDKSRESSLDGPTDLPSSKLEYGVLPEKKLSCLFGVQLLPLADGTVAPFLPGDIVYEEGEQRKKSDLPRTFVITNEVERSILTICSSSIVDDAAVAALPHFFCKDVLLSGILRTTYLTPRYISEVFAAEALGLSQPSMMAPASERNKNKPRQLLWDKNSKDDRKCIAITLVWKYLREVLPKYVQWCCNQSDMAWFTSILPGAFLEKLAEKSACFKMQGEDVTREALYSFLLREWPLIPVLDSKNCYLQSIENGASVVLCGEVCNQTIRRLILQLGIRIVDVDTVCGQDKGTSPGHKCESVSSEISGKKPGSIDSEIFRVLAVAAPAFYHMNTTEGLLKAIVAGPLAMKRVASENPMLCQQLQKCTSSSVGRESHDKDLLRAIPATQACPPPSSPSLTLQLSTSVSTRKLLNPAMNPATSILDRSVGRRNVVRCSESKSKSVRPDYSSPTRHPPDRNTSDGSSAFLRLLGLLEGLNVGANLSTKDVSLAAEVAFSIKTMFDPVMAGERRELRRFFAQCDNEQTFTMHDIHGLLLRLLPIFEVYQEMRVNSEGADCKGEQVEGKNGKTEFAPLLDSSMFVAPEGVCQEALTKSFIRIVLPNDRSLLRTLGYGPIALDQFYAHYFLPRLRKEEEWCSQLVNRVFSMSSKIGEESELELNRRIASCFDSEIYFLPSEVRDTTTIRLLHDLPDLRKTNPNLVKILWRTPLIPVEVDKNRVNPAWTRKFWQHSPSLLKRERGDRPTQGPGSGATHQKLEAKLVKKLEQKLAEFQRTEPLFCPCDLFDPTVPILAKILPGHCFPSSKFRTLEALEILRSVGMVTNLSRSSILESARYLDRISREAPPKCVASARHEGEEIYASLEVVGPAVEKPSFAIAEALLRVIDENAKRLFENTPDTGLGTSVNNPHSEDKDVYVNQPAYEASDFVQELSSLRWVPIFTVSPHVNLPWRMQKPSNFGSSTSVETTSSAETYAVAAPCNARLPDDMWLCSSDKGIIKGQVNSKTLIDAMGWSRPLEATTLARQLVAISSMCGEVAGAIVDDDSSTTSQHWTIVRIPGTALKSILLKTLPRLYGLLQSTVGLVSVPVSDPFSADTEKSNSSDCVSRALGLEDNHDFDEQALKSIREILQGKKWVWVGTGFARSEQVAFAPVLPNQSFLFSVLPLMRPISSLLRKFGVGERIATETYLAILADMPRNRSLNPNELQFALDVVNAFHFLNFEQGGETPERASEEVHADDVIDNSMVEGGIPISPSNTAQIYLPNEKGVLCEASTLTVNDASWIEEPITYVASGNFTHTQICQQIALAAGATSLCALIVQGGRTVHKIACPSAKLINHCLANYCDEHYVLLDVLDAAGVQIIYDKRSHPERSVISHSLRELQGPAVVLVLEDRKLAKEEIIGLMNGWIPLIDQSVRGRDARSMGWRLPAKASEYPVYGAGLSSAFLWSDCIEVLSGPWMCFFDPTGKYFGEVSGVQKTLSHESGYGKQYDSRRGPEMSDIEEKAQETPAAGRCYDLHDSKLLGIFRDQFLPYSSLGIGWDSAKFSQFRHTIIRIPLRSEASTLHGHCPGESYVDEALRRLEATPELSLLFATSLQKMSVKRWSPASEKEELVCEVALKTPSRTSSDRLNLSRDTEWSKFSFSSFLRRQQCKTNTFVVDIVSRRPCYPSMENRISPTIAEEDEIPNVSVATSPAVGSTTVEDRWLVTEVLGGAMRKPALSKRMQAEGVVPYAAVAGHIMSNGEPAQPVNGKLCCTIGTQHETGLPVHVNGCFLLFPRQRNLMGDEQLPTSNRDDSRLYWNRQLFMHGVVEAFVAFLGVLKGNLEKLDAGSLARQAQRERRSSKTALSLNVPSTRFAANQREDRTLHFESQLGSGAAMWKDIIYQFWPNQKCIKSPYSSLIPPTFFSKLAAQPLLLSSHDTFCTASEVYFFPHKNDGTGSSMPPKVKTYIIERRLIPVVDVPQHVWETLKSADGNTIRVLAPSVLRDCLRQNSKRLRHDLEGNRWDTLLVDKLVGGDVESLQLSDAEDGGDDVSHGIIFDLLSACVADFREAKSSEAQLPHSKLSAALEGLPLLPLLGGGVGTFSSRRRSLGRGSLLRGLTADEMYLIGDEKERRLLWNQHHRFVHPRAVDILEECFDTKDALMCTRMGLHRVKPASLKSFLPDILPKAWVGKPAVNWVPFLRIGETNNASAGQQHIVPSVEWICLFWSIVDFRDSDMVKKFSEWPLIPVKASTEESTLIRCERGPQTDLALPEARGFGQVDLDVAHTFTKGTVLMSCSIASIALSVWISDEDHTRRRGLALALSSRSVTKNALADSVAPNATVNDNVDEEESEIVAFDESVWAGLMTEPPDSVWADATQVGSGEDLPQSDRLSGDGEVGEIAQGSPVVPVTNYVLLEEDEDTQGISSELPSTPVLSGLPDDSTESSRGPREQAFSSVAPSLTKSNQALHQILLDLGIPVLDTAFFMEYGEALRSSDNRIPHLLLSSIADLQKGGGALQWKNVSAEDREHLLKYLVMRSREVGGFDEAEKQTLRGLPIFATLSGEHVELDQALSPQTDTDPYKYCAIVDNTVSPQLLELRVFQIKNCLLKKQEGTYAFIQSLGVPLISDARVIRHFVYPAIANGTGRVEDITEADAAFTDMIQVVCNLWSMLREDADFVQWLKEERIFLLRNQDSPGTGKTVVRRARARDLLDPRNSLFLDIFKNERDARFPAPNYSSPRWLAFMTDLGMTKSFTTEIYVECARKLEGQCDEHGEVSTEIFGLAQRLIKEMIDNLVIFHSSSFYKTVSEISFVPATQPHLPTNSRRGSRSASGAYQPLALYRFQDICVEKDRELAFCVMPVLGDGLAPPSHIWPQLGIVSPPKLHVVLQQLCIVSGNAQLGDEAISESVAATALPTSSSTKSRLTVTDENTNSLDSWCFESSPDVVFEKIFSYLQKHWSNIPPLRRNLLQNMAFVPMGGRFVKPARLFFRLTTSLQPFMFEIPRIFGACDKLFQNLGCKYQPEAEDYELFLQELHAETKGIPLNPNELDAVAKVVELLADKLYSNAEGDDNGGSASSSRGNAFFIPDTNFVLQPFQSCLVNDADWLVPRMNMRYLSLVSSLIPTRVCELLHIPKLSECVVEKLYEVHDSSPEASGDSQSGSSLSVQVLQETLTEKIHSEAFQSSLTRLIQHTASRLREDHRATANVDEKALNMLRGYRVKCPHRIQTKLFLRTRNTAQQASRSAQIAGTTQENLKGSIGAEIDVTKSSENTSTLHFVDHTDRVLYIATGTIPTSISVEQLVAQAITELVNLKSIDVSIVASLLRCDSQQQMKDVLDIHQIHTDPVGSNENRRGRPGQALLPLDMRLLDIKPLHPFVNGECVALTDDGMKFYYGTVIGQVGDGSRQSRACSESSIKKEEEESSVRRLKIRIAPMTSVIRYTTEIFTFRRATSKDLMDLEERRGSDSFTQSTDRDADFLSPSLSLKPFASVVSGEQQELTESSGTGMGGLGQASAGETYAASKEQERRPISRKQVVHAARDLLLTVGVDLDKDFEKLMQERVELREELQDRRTRELDLRRQLFLAEREITELKERSLCPVCHDAQVNNILVPCGHKFCSSCVSQFRSQQCPYCRSRPISICMFYGGN